MKYFLVVLVLFCLPLIHAYDVNIALSSNEIVSESFVVDLNDFLSYDSFEYISLSKPISIEYEGDYEISETEEGYKIRFSKNDDSQELKFTLMYKDMIDSSSNRMVFRAGFDSADRITLTLPEKNALSDEPNSIPLPNKISSDGKNIILYWENVSSIAVFYEGKDKSYYLIYFIILIFLILFLAIAYSRRKIKSAVREILSEDEKLIIEQVEKGVKKQKEIARNLNFSKSKMSKVVRKLEEKKLIEKNPHFKTNIIKLKKI